MDRIFVRILKDSGVYGGADFFGKFFYFISFPIIASYLNPEAYGVLGDPYKRGRYDCMTERSHTSLHTFPMTDPFRIFIFSGY